MLSDLGFIFVLLALKLSGEYGVIKKNMQNKNIEEISPEISSKMH